MRNVPFESAMKTKIQEIHVKTTSRVLFYHPSQHNEFELHQNLPQNHGYHTLDPQEMPACNVDECERYSSIHFLTIFFIINQIGPMDIKNPAS